MWQLAGKKLHVSSSLLNVILAQIKKLAGFNQLLQAFSDILTKATELSTMINDMFNAGGCIAGIDKNWAEFASWTGNAVLEQLLK